MLQRGTKNSGCYSATNFETAPESTGVELFYSAYREMRPSIFELAFSLVKQQQTAEDITQEVFVKLWTQRDLLHQVRDMNSYLYMMARNLCINHFRKNKLHKLLLKSLESDFVTYHTPHDYFVEKETMQSLQLAIQRMPSQRMRVFILGLQGLRIKEIAAYLNISPFTVKNLMKQARKDARMSTMRFTGVKQKSILKKFKQSWNGETLSKVA